MQLWNKYLPVIKILLKKAISSEQVLDLNRIDFERAGIARKAGYKFSIDFNRGRVANVISGSPLASSLAAAMLEDASLRTLLQENHYSVSLNTKFQLLIKNASPDLEATPADNDSAVEAE